MDALHTLELLPDTEKLFNLVKYFIPLLVYWSTVVELILRDQLQHRCEIPDWFSGSKIGNAENHETLRATITILFILYFSSIKPFHCKW